MFGRTQGIDGIPVRFSTGLIRQQKPVSQAA
jgi:hypothetical protein